MPTAKKTLQQRVVNVGFSHIENISYSARPNGCHDIYPKGVLLKILSRTERLAMAFFEKPFLIFLQLSLPVLFAVSCVHKSTFKIPSEVKNSTVIDYCGGQQWGYVRPLASHSTGPFHGIFLEFSSVQDQEVLLLNFVIESARDLTVTFQERIIEIERDGKSIYKKPSSFWIIRDAKPIDQLYPRSEYSLTKVPDTLDEWRVHKQCKGLGCNLFWQPPFTVKIPEFANEATFSNTISVKLDPALNRVYILDKIVVPMREKKFASSILKVHAPAFVANGASVPATVHTFYFDRERLIRKLPAKNGCLSLNQIFNHARAQRVDPLSWILDPFIID